MNTHLRDHNHSKSDDEQANLIVEKITANVAVVHVLKAMDMNRRAARWNWFSKLDPVITSAWLAALFALVWMLRTIWLTQ